MRIFQFGDEPSTYQQDFVRHTLPERMTRNKSTILRLKEFAARRSVAVPSKPQVYWTTPSFGKIQEEGKPSFTAYLREPKEIVGRLPVPNLDFPKDNLEEMLTKHEEVIRTRPRVLFAPNQMAADDGIEEERKTHAKHIYYRENLPGHTAGDSVHHPNIEMKIPKDSYKTTEFAKPTDLYPRVKPALKKCFARLDFDKERWLEFSDPNYNRKKVRAPEESSTRTDKEWEESLRELHNSTLSQKKYRNYALGYTGHVPSTNLPVRKERVLTVDPMVSFYEALDSRRDDKVLQTEAGIREKFGDMPLDMLRIIHGVGYIPTQAYYSKDINNLPLKKYRKVHYL